VFAPSDGSVPLTANCANRVISGLSNVVVRTSTYADFAKTLLPTGLVDITGVATRYNDTWQILMRRLSDITASSTEPAPVATPTGSGTEADPYNVAAVTKFTKALAADAQAGPVYAKGYVVKITDIDTSGSYGNATYLISDQKDGSTGSFQVYRGYGLNNVKFNAGATLKEGDEVTVYGKVVNYKGNTPQFAQGSYIYEQNGKKK
jgi:DNA/RNA endonuclease YhcR with UshA esterase domain